MKVLTDTLLNGRFELNEAHKERNKRILGKLSESMRKVSKKEAYRQHDLIKASSNRR